MVAGISASGAEAGALNIAMDEAAITVREPTFPAGETPTAAPHTHFPHGEQFRIVLWTAQWRVALFAALGGALGYVIGFRLFPATESLPGEGPDSWQVLFGTVAILAFLVLSREGLEHRVLHGLWPSGHPAKLRLGAMYLRGTLLISIFAICQDLYASYVLHDLWVFAGWITMMLTLTGTVHAWHCGMTEVPSRAAKQGKRAARRWAFWAYLLAIQILILRSIHSGLTYAPDLAEHASDYAYLVGYGIGCAIVPPVAALLCMLGQGWCGYLAGLLIDGLRTRSERVRLIAGTFAFLVLNLSPLLVIGILAVFAHSAAGRRLVEQSVMAILLSFVGSSIGIMLAPFVKHEIPCSEMAESC
jgi:hypothetical protein